MAHGLYKNARFRLAGDRGLLVEYGDGIDPAINHKVRSMAVVLAERRQAGVIEIVPTYRSLLILYDPSTTGPEALKPDLAALESQLAGIRIRPPKTVEIPVRYGGEYGPDIGFVADAHGLTEEEVVGLHSAPEYLIYMVGFTPGFPFLGGLPETLHTPRLETPRTHVPEGSVGIANAQTGVYPVASPGGWRLIGRTPLRLFAPDRETPFLYEAGDRIRFVPVSAEQYARIADQERLP